MAQFVEPLAGRGIELTISPFLDSGQFKDLYESGSVAEKFFGLARSISMRLRELLAVRKYDLIFVQREAMIFGPAIFEWTFQKFGNRPVILDLDDATYVSYVSPSYGRIGSFFKFFGKTDALIRRADAVTCGNRFIAEYVESKGTRAVVIPTVVDTEKFRPTEKTEKIPVIGWIGTHSTYPFLESLFPVLKRLASKHRFALKIVGAGCEATDIDGIEIENLEWDLDREIADFQSLDIGLYPILTSASANDEWLKGKSGFKAIQYMAVGVSFVMSPVGVAAEIGEPGLTHFNAETEEDWYNSMDRLLSDETLRSKMGKTGRAHVLEHYHVSKQAEKLQEIMIDVLKQQAEKLNR